MAFGEVDAIFVSLIVLLIVFVIVSCSVSCGVVFLLSRREARRRALRAALEGTSEDEEHELLGSEDDLIEDGEGRTVEDMDIELESETEDEGEEEYNPPPPGIWSTLFDAIARFCGGEIDKVLDTIDAEDAEKERLLKQREELIASRQKKKKLCHPLDVDISLEDEDEEEQKKIEFELDEIETVDKNALIRRRLMNCLYIFILQLRLRKSYFLLYFLFISKDPMNLVMIPTAILLVLIESTIFAIILVVYYRKDLHSSLAITLRWELEKENRYVKYFLFLILTLVLGVSVVLFTYNSFSTPTLEDTPVFKHLFGGNCTCNSTRGVTDAEVYDPAQLIPTGDGPWAYVVWFIQDIILDKFLDLIKAYLMAFLLYKGVVQRKISYDGPSSERYVKLLRVKEMPDIHITLKDVITKKSGAILKDFLLVLFFVESKSEVEKLSRLSSYSHYDWGLVKGLSTKKIIKLRDYFFDFSQEEDFDSCQYRNESLVKSFFRLFKCCRKEQKKKAEDVNKAIEDARNLQKEQIKKIKNRKAAKLGRLKRKEDLYYYLRKIEGILSQIELNLKYIDERKKHCYTLQIKLRYNRKNNIRELIDPQELEYEKEQLEKDDKEGIWRVCMKMKSLEEVIDIDRKLTILKTNLLEKEKLIVLKQKRYKKEQLEIAALEEEEEKAEIKDEVTQLLEEENRDRIAERQLKEAILGEDPDQKKSDLELIEEKREEKQEKQKKRIIFGIIYVAYIQFKLRMDYLMIIMMLITSSLGQLVLCLVVLGLDYVIILSVMLYRYRHDLHSPFRIIIRWELDRESRLLKYYSFFMLIFIYLIGISCVFDLEKIYDILISSNPVAMFSRTDPYNLFNHAVIQPIPTISMINCTCERNWSRIWGTLSPGEQMSTELYFWSFLLIPFVKYVLTGFLMVVKTLYRSLNYDGPAAMRYYNELQEKDEESFHTNPDFPNINFSFGRMMQKTKKIFQNTLNVLFFVSSKEDVEAFSKIPSLRHLDWDLVKKLDTRTIRDLRLFFFKVDEEKEVAMDKGLIEDQFETWLYKNESCCLCKLIFNCIFFCKPFGNEIETMKEKKIHELENTVREYEFSQETLSNEILLLRKQLKAIDTFEDDDQPRLSRLSIKL